MTNTSWKEMINVRKRQREPTEFNGRNSQSTVCLDNLTVAQLVNIPGIL